MGKESTAYWGIDRRRHRVLVTQNTEYHFRDGLCVAVRDRRTGEWLADHAALQRTVSGCVQFGQGGVTVHKRPPVEGESLFFATGGRGFVTSSLLQELRPEKSVVDEYPAGLRGLRRRATRR